MTAGSGDKKIRHSQFVLHFLLGVGKRWRDTKTTTATTMMARDTRKHKNIHTMPRAVCFDERRTLDTTENLIAAHENDKDNQIEIQGSHDRVHGHVQGWFQLVGEVVIKSIVSEEIVLGIDSRRSGFRL
jgi:hypothetical protein